MKDKKHNFIVIISKNPSPSLNFSLISIQSIVTHPPKYFLTKILKTISIHSKTTTKTLNTIINVQISKIKRII